MEMSEIQAVIEKVKNRTAVKKVLAVTLRICDIHYLKEIVAELGRNICERKEILPAPETLNCCQNAPKWDRRNHNV